MACLKFTVACEISEKRKSSFLGNFEFYEGDLTGYSLWRLQPNSRAVVGRKKLVGSHGKSCFGFYFGNGEGKPSNGSLLTVSFPSPSCFGRQNIILSNRLQDVRLFGADGASGMPLAPELVEECESRQFDEETSDGENLILKNTVTGFVELKNKAVNSTLERKGRRKTRNHILGTKRAVQKLFSLPVSTESSRSKYIRKDATNLEGIVSSIGPQASVEHCNNVLKLLEQSSEQKALDFFDWMKRNGKLKQNTTAYNLILRVLGQKEDWNAAELLLDEMISDSDCQLNFQVFNTLIYVCAKRGIVERGAKWFSLMLERGIQPNVATFGMLMGLYQKGGNLSEAEFTFDYMRRCKLHHVASYSAMITIYTRLRLYDKSEEIIGLMREDEVTPNLENWLVQLNAYCQKGKLEEAESVFNSMQESGFSANVVAYNTLITGYGKASDTEAAQRLFQTLQNFGLEPDETTYRSMIEGYGRTNNYKEAKWYYEELKSSGFHPNASNFYTMVNLQARHGDDSGVIQTLIDMRAVGCQYPSMLSTLLHAYERVGGVDKVPLILEGSILDNILLDPISCSTLVLAYVRNSLLDDALQILQKRRWRDSTFEDNLYHTLICSCKEACNYEGAVMIFNQMPKPEENPNLHITCSMIDIYSCMGRFNDAEDLYLKLKDSRVQLDMIAYSIVVRMYVKSGSLKDACVILDMIEKQKDIIPDTYLFRDMLRIYQQCGMLEKLANTYYKMLKSGVAWDEAMYNCVINCCGRALPVDEISRLFDEMLQHGYAASTITFNVMLDIYGKAGLLKKAGKVFQMARKQGLIDVISYNTLIAAYGQNKDFKRMRFTIQQMQHAGYRVSLEAYNCLLDAYGKEDQSEEFNDVLQKMKEARCASDHYTYNILINIYGKKGWIEDVGCVLAELRNHGLEPDLYSYNSLIKAYGIAGMVEEAVDVVKEMRANGLQPDRVTYVNLIAALQRNENFLEAVKWSLWMKQRELSGWNSGSPLAGT